MKKQNAAIWCALLLIALPIAVLLLVPSPSARIVDVVQPLMESEEIDYWNPDIFFLTKYGLTAAVSALCGLVLTLLCSRKRLSLDTRAAICTVGGFGALVGARVLYMLARYSYIMVDLGGSSFFWQFWQGGYTLYGGILGGMGAIALYAKLTKQKALPLLDAVTPGALLALCGLLLAEGFTGQGFSKQMDDICWYFLPFQNEDGQMLVWAYEAIVAAVALVIVLVQGRRQKIAGRTLETGLTTISVMQVLLDSWRADELIRFGEGQLVVSLYRRLAGHGAAGGAAGITPDPLHPPGWAEKNQHCAHCDAAGRRGRVHRRGICAGQVCHQQRNTLWGDDARACADVHRRAAG